MDLSKIFIDNKYQIFTPDNNNKPIIIFINYTDNNVFDIIEKYSNKSIEFVVDSFYKNKIDDYNKNIIYLENFNNDIFNNDNNKYILKKNISNNQKTDYEINIINNNLINISELLVEFYNLIIIPLIKNYSNIIQSYYNDIFYDIIKLYKIKISSNSLFNNNNKELIINYLNNINTFFSDDITQIINKIYIIFSFIDIYNSNFNSKLINKNIIIFILNDNNYNILSNYLEKTSYLNYRKRTININTIEKLLNYEKLLIPKFNDLPKLILIEHLTNDMKLSIEKNKFYVERMIFNDKLINNYKSLFDNNKFNDLYNNKSSDLYNKIYNFYSIILNDIINNNFDRIKLYNNYYSILNRILNDEISENIHFYNIIK